MGPNTAAPAGPARPPITHRSAENGVGPPTGAGIKTDSLPGPHPTPAEAPNGHGCTAEAAWPSSSSNFSIAAIYRNRIGSNYQPQRRVAVAVTVGYNRMRVSSRNTSTPSEQSTLAACKRILKSMQSASVDSLRYAWHGSSASAVDLVGRVTPNEYHPGRRIRPKGSERPKGHLQLESHFNRNHTVVSVLHIKTSKRHL